jgi:putative pyruvate formate lyase activating enzyme
VRLSAPELLERARSLAALSDPCVLCPRECGVRRGEGETGVCGSTLELEVASYGPHFGEESVLVGPRGSGTIFFCHCNLLCSFCQNYDISHYGRGRRVSTRELAAAVLELQRMGCSNINLVTPTHYAAPIVEALAAAVTEGLDLPIVYNCGGYESVAALALLDGVVDIYMPDAKFGERASAEEFCDAPDYPEAMIAALREMQRQVGDLDVGSDGLASRGLLVRHLVMPGDLAASASILESVSREVSQNAAVNVMDQYRPCFRAATDPGVLGRRLSAGEHEAVLEVAEALGLRILP